MQIHLLIDELFTTGGNNLLVRIHLLIDELSALPINDRRSMITIQTDKVTVFSSSQCLFAEILSFYAT